MKLIFGIFFAFVAMAAVFLGIIYYSYSIDAGTPEINAATEYCLRSLGLSEVDWKTAVITRTKRTDIEKKFLWRVFSNLNLWKDWHGLWLTSVGWNNGSEWKAGGRFKEALDLGFPLGQKEFAQKIIRASNEEKETQIVWTSDQGGFKSCHAWFIIQQNDGSSYIINTAVFNGMAIGYARPFIVSPWLKMFDDDIRGLIRESAIRM